MDQATLLVPSHAFDFPEDIRLVIWDLPRMAASMVPLQFDADHLTAAGSLVGLELTGAISSKPSVP